MISKNETDFQKVGEKKVSLNNDSKIKVEDFSFSFKELTGRYVKIKAYNIGKCPNWHKGAGGKAWVFCDEVIIE